MLLEADDVFQDSIVDELDVEFLILYIDTRLKQDLLLIIEVVKYLSRLSKNM